MNEIFSDDHNILGMAIYLNVFSSSTCSTVYYFIHSILIYCYRIVLGSI